MDKEIFDKWETTGFLECIDQYIDKFDTPLYNFKYKYNLSKILEDISNILVSDYRAQ